MGSEFAADVAQRGAAAILWEPDGRTEPPALALGHRAGTGARSCRGAPANWRIASSAFRRASWSSPGVTGTNGKTTCAWLLAQALTAVGRPAAYVGTLGSAFAGELVAGEMTTPDAVTVQRQLAAFRARGARKVAMEVSSHGLAQGRVKAVRFDAAVFTNLTRDHLDFHGDMATYGAAKASLFERAKCACACSTSMTPSALRAGGAAAVRRPHCLQPPCSRQRAATCSRATSSTRPRAPPSRWTPASATHASPRRCWANSMSTTCWPCWPCCWAVAVELQRGGRGAGRRCSAPSGRLEAFTRAGKPTVGGGLRAHAGCAGQGAGGAAPSLRRPADRGVRLRRRPRPRQAARDGRHRRAPRRPQSCSPTTTRAARTAQQHHRRHQGRCRCACGRR